MIIPRRKPYINEADIKEFKKLLSGRDFNKIELIEQWEKEIKTYINIKNSAIIDSGRRGMYFILKYLNLKQGDEIIIPAYTLKSLLPLIQNFKIKIVPADIDLYTFNITPETIKKRISSKTKALIVLHTFGNPCRMDEIMALAEANNITVIEDCAHSFGSTINGRQTGSFGYASFFSFEVIKSINTFGGGCVVSQDNNLTKFIHREIKNDAVSLKFIKKKLSAISLENFLFKTGLAFPALFLLSTKLFNKYINSLYRKLQHPPKTYYKYLPIQAELGLKQIKTINQRIRQRQKNVEYIKSILKPEIIIQKVEADCSSTYYFLVAILPVKSDKIRHKLLLHGIDVGIEGEITDNCAKILGYNDCPNVEHIYYHAISLPMYDTITKKQLQKTAKRVNKSI